MIKMRLIDVDDPKLYEKVYCPQDWGGIEEYPLVIEWEDLLDAPAVDAEFVRYEHWDENGRCTGCGNHAPFWCMASTYYLSPYCQHCGAKMGTC